MGKKNTAGRSVDARCPFYRRDTASTVTCEGPVEESTVQIRFGRVCDCDIQVSGYCCGAYQYCPIYRAVMEDRYDEE